MIMPRQIFRHDFDGSEPDPEPLRILNEAPPWRRFAQKNSFNGDFKTRKMDPEQARIGKTYQADEIEARLINAALALRRPLLISGHAGMGKSSLAYAVAWQLDLGNVLRWSITSHSTLKAALYEYDAVARLQDASLGKQGISTLNPQDVGSYITLGALGTALLSNGDGPYQPRVLLIDEIDKSDIDLPNDLLHVLEEGSFEVPEIARARLLDDVVRVRVSRSMSEVDIPANGVITCDDFPLVLMTTNGEREFSPAFRRRCLELTIPRPSREKLERIIRAQLEWDGQMDVKISELLNRFEERLRDEKFRLAVDQLLNGIYLSQSKADVDPTQHKLLLEAVFHSLTEQSNPSVS